MPTGEMMKLTNVRLSYPALFQRKRHKNNKPDDPGKFQSTFILDPSNKAHAEMIAMVKAEGTRIYKEAWPKGAKLKGKCYGLNTAPDEALQLVNVRRIRNRDMLDSLLPRLLREFFHTTIRRQTNHPHALGNLRRHLQRAVPDRTRRTQNNDIATAHS